MKIILALLLFILSARAGEPDPITSPTDRTKEVEKEFGIKAAYTYKDLAGRDWCTFVGKVSSPKLSFGFIPIAVRADATDDQIRAAIDAVVVCAGFYEESMLKKHRK